MRNCAPGINTNATFIPSTNWCGDHTKKCQESNCKGVWIGHTCNLRKTRENESDWMNEFSTLTNCLRQPFNSFSPPRIDIAAKQPVGDATDDFPEVSNALVDECCFSVGRISCWHETHNSFKYILYTKLIFRIAFDRWRLGRACSFNHQIYFVRVHWYFR